ncbi:MAG: hypothetical protein FWD23_18300 [Oscillospiraceae bacterium]|nr:hypothetical protein [Oscillospiraceae bacterium]
MREITIDEEFKALLPALDAQTYALLEESLLANGCLHPLVLWNGVLIDGHNRYEICTKHEIEFETIDKEFGSRDEALIWIISTQVARRNLTPMQLSYYRGAHYNADKRVQGTANQYSEQSEKRHNDVQPKIESTAVRLAEQYNVSPRTIDRDAQVARAIDAIGGASPEAKREILSGAAEISRKSLRELGAEPEETIAAAAASIADGTYERRKAASEVLYAHGILALFNTTFGKMASEFDAAMQCLRDEVGADELRAVVRGHIDALEAIYDRI